LAGKISVRKERQSMGRTQVSIKKRTAQPDVRDKLALKKVGLERAKQVSKLLRTVCDPSRLRIMLLLSRGGTDVQSIAAHLGKIQPATSQHLALLRHSELIKPRREGVRKIYSLTQSGQKIARFIETLMAPSAPRAASLKGRANVTNAPRKVVGQTLGSSRIRFKSSDPGEWEALNRRRLHLIDKEVEKGLTGPEEAELHILQGKADAYLDLIAPLPFEIFDRLRESAKKDGLDVSFLEEE
jgi:DNA-binding transcriptional ArsR family regulator